MLSLFVLSQTLIRTPRAHFHPADARPRKGFPSATPLESALPQNASITRLESALTEKVGGGGKLLTRCLSDRILFHPVEAPARMSGFDPGTRMAAAWSV